LLVRRSSNCNRSGSSILAPDSRASFQLPAAEDSRSEAKPARTRPVNLDIGSIQLPITAYASICHRVSGVSSCFSPRFCSWRWALDMQPRSAPRASHRWRSGSLHRWLRIVTWAVATGLIYHTLAGMKHLIADIGIGEELDGRGCLGARLVFLFAVASVAIGGVILW
jgi:succinate dehydrogenase / fumarate reductase cytochrome b subunit